MAGAVFCCSRAFGPTEGKAFLFRRRESGVSAVSSGRPDALLSGEERGTGPGPVPKGQISENAGERADAFPVL